MNIAEIRRKYPQYDGVSDGDLALALHRKFYPDMHVKDFMSRIDPDDRARFTVSDKMWPYWEQQVSKPMDGETDNGTARRVAGDLVRPGRRLSEDLLRSAGQGMTFGGMDELVGGVAAAAHPLVHGQDGSTISERFDAYTGRERNKLGTFRAQHPVASVATEIGGALMTVPVAPALTPFKGAGTTALVGNAAATGATYGGAYGFGTAEGNVAERAPGALRGSLIGAGTGATLPLVAKGMGWLFRPRAKGVDISRLKQASQDLARRADSNGMVVNPGRIKRFLKEAEDALRLNPVNHKGTRSVLDQLRQQADEPFTPTRMQEWRQQINDGVTTTGFNVDANGKKALELRTLYDKMVDGLTNTDVATAANPKDVTMWLKQHRALWRRFRNMEKLERMQTIAERHSQSSQAVDPARAMRNEMKKLANKITLGKERSFNPAEYEAINAAAVGTRPSRALKMAGKFRFDPTGNMVGGGAGAAAGYMVGGAPGAFLVPTAGTAAQWAQNAMLRRYMQNAINTVGGVDDPLVRSLTATVDGVSGPVVNMAAPTGARLAAPLARALQTPAGAAALQRGIHPLLQRQQLPSIWQQ